MSAFDKLISKLNDIDSITITIECSTNNTKIGMSTKLSVTQIKSLNIAFKTDAVDIALTRMCDTLINELN